MRLTRIVESINVAIDEKDGQKIKESSKYSMEHYHETDLKEEKVDEESYEEEEKQEAEKDQQDLQEPPKTPSR
jgi:hypothetical protein